MANPSPKIKKLGDAGYVNQNCWLARNLNYPPTKHCQYCQLKLRNCLFERYMIVTLVLVCFIVIASYIIDGSVSRSLIFAIFAIFITYGYFFDRSTQKMIEANFEEKKAKDAFKDLNSDLQQKVDDQTKDIKKAFELEKGAKEELESLSQSKDQFLMTIQHHLRTPLTVMKGCVEMLAEGECGKQSKKTAEVISRFGKSTDKLIKMVNEFLDITQFQVGKQVIALRPGVNINIMLSDILDELNPEAIRKGIYLQLNSPSNFNVKADAEKLKAALYNIIDNAVKYTPTGGVKIKVRLNNSSDLLIISEDTGIGIKKEILNNLFSQIFERSDQAKNVFATGRGMGLYISSQIIRAHGGKIWAESEGEGKGSRFFIELPMD
ncbi:MAG: HAMP domain-containing sensor histidine kinase [Candidatus Staskawiczbacteria bacterium]|nr:HAMP domain-containing sensor histidine kinase [Candidatus Staskawiczbacteria bacterium]